MEANWLCRGYGRHCHASSWTFALRNFILDRVRGVVRVIVIVVFDDELFWFRSCRVVVEHLSGSASRVDFEIHCFEVPFCCREFYGMIIITKCNSEAVQNYAQVLQVHATIDFHGVLCGHCNVMTPCWVGFFHSLNSSCSEFKDVCACTSICSIFLRER